MFYVCEKRWYLTTNPHPVLAGKRIPTTKTLTMKIHELEDSLPTSFKVVRLSVDSKWGLTETSHVVSSTNVAKSVAKGILRYDSKKDTYHKVSGHSFLSKEGILLFSEKEGTIKPNFG